MPPLGDSTSADHPIAPGIEPSLGHQILADLLEETAACCPCLDGFFRGVMFAEVCQGAAQRGFPDQNELGKTFALDRAYPTFRVTIGEGCQLQVIVTLPIHLRDHSSFSSAARSEVPTGDLPPQLGRGPGLFPQCRRALDLGSGGLDDRSARGSVCGSGPRAVSVPLRGLTQVDGFSGATSVKTGPLTVKGIG
jgi:hypothetical protein